MQSRKSILALSVLSALIAIISLSGCQATIVLTPEQRLSDAVPNVQVQDPRNGHLPAGETVTLAADVTIITDIQTDLVVSELPNQTILGFDNQTGLDLHLKYNANDVLQAVYVYDGETLLLDYPCLDSMELVSEDDIDPQTGEVINSFDLTNGLYTNPQDFACGDAFIVTFDPNAIQAGVQLLDLLQ